MAALPGSIFARKEGFDFGDPWPEVTVALSDGAERIVERYRDEMAGRTQLMRLGAKDPYGELHAKKTAKRRKRSAAARGTLFPATMADVMREGPSAAAAALWFEGQGARTLADIDRIIYIDADTVNLVESILRFAMAAPEVAAQSQRSEDELNWECECSAAIEAFEICIEHAASFDVWGDRRFGACELLEEAINAGRRKWTEEVLTCKFPMATPADAGWYCCLLGTAAGIWRECHAGPNTILRNYVPDDVIRLAWPILGGGPFSTDKITLPAAKREWNQLGKSGREKWEDFDDFFDSARLKTWHAFIERINTTCPPIPQPALIYWSGFTERVIQRLAPVAARMGREIDWNQELRSRWNLPSFLETMGGCLFEMERWPRRNRRIPEPPTIKHHGERSFSIDDTPPVDLTDPESEVLRKFIGRPTMRLNEIEGQLKIQAARILRKLREKYDGRFAPAIRLPGGKGRGGYHVRISSSLTANGQH